MTHSGNGTQGQTLAYTITPSATTTNTSADVFADFTLPPGMTFSSFSGTGWTCNGTVGNNTFRCGTIYTFGPSNPGPPLTLITAIAANAATSLTPSVILSGGGASATASASSPTTVNQVAASVTINAGNNQSANINTAFTMPFQVTVKDAGGVAIPSTSVTFTAPASGASGTFATGGTNSQTVTANGSGVATASTFTANGTGGSYNVSATSGSASANFSVTNIAAPTVTTNPTNQSVNEGSTATFTAAASGSPTPTVQWQQSTNGGSTFTDISGATSTTLTLNSVSYSQNNYQYRAVFTNSANSATTTAATLTVNRVADLAITKTDGVTSVSAGGSTTYTITASNSGPSNASGATVADTLPGSISSASWTCVGAGGGTCNASGTGNINESVNLPSGGSVTFTVAAQISSSATGTLSNTATVTAPSGVTDNNSSNNSATDSDSITATTTTTVSSGQATQAVSGSVTFTATISGSPTGGTVAFRSGGTNISTCATQSVTGGTATCTTSFATAGTYSISAVYSGTSGYAGSTSSTISQYVVAPPTVSAAFGASSITTAQSTTLTVTITNPSANTVPLNTVTFAGMLNGLTGISLGSGTCSPVGFSGPFNVAGATINANSSCTIVINIPSGQSPGTYNYTPSAASAAGANGQALSLTGVGGSQVTLSVTPPTLSISNVSHNEGNSGTTSFDFTVSLSTPAGAGGVTFDIATADGTATTAHNDYIAKSLTAQTIPAGQSSYTFSVLVVGNTIVEPDKTFTVNVSNVSGATASGSGTGTIVNDDFAPTVTSVSPTSGPGNGNTSVTITGTALSGATGVTFGGTAATGLTANTATSITVTAPSGTGTVDVVVTTPSGSSAITAADHYSYVAGPSTTQAIASVTGVAGTNLSVTPVTSTGGYGSVSYALSGGSLPTGLSFNTSTGVLSGTPTVTFTSTVFTVTATDAASQSSSKTFNLTVSAPTIALSPASLTAATVGVATSQTVSASGGNGSYSYSITAGALPAGMSLSSSGTVSGTPTAGGTFNFTITATDGNHFAGAQAYSLTVNAPTIVVAPSTLATSLAVGTAVNQTFTASGGTAPFSYRVTSGALPAGLTLSTAGVLTGAPTAQGSYNFTVTATDSSTGTGPYTGSQAYSVSTNKGDQTISFTSTAPASAAVGGASYTVTATATSGLTVAFTLDGASTGCSLSGSTVTFTSTGTCRIDANQAGDGNWNAAPQLQQSFAVGAAQAIGASVSFAANPLNAGATGTVTISFTNGNASTAPLFSTLLTSPSNLTRVIGAPGGTCAVGSASIPTQTTIQLTNVTVPSGGCTITFNYTGTTAGSLSGFTLSGFTPTGYPATPGVSSSSVAVLPTVTAINPTSGRPSQTVTLTGTGFDTTVANNIVRFGSTTATVTAATATTLTVTAPSAGSGTVSVTATVNGQTSPGGVNFTFIDTPIAADKTGVTVAYNSAGTAIDLSGSITGGPHSSIAVGTAPQHGTTAIAGDVVTYTPTAGYYGTDSFTYSASGTGGTSNTATVSLTVATPPAPTASDRTGVSIGYNSTGTAIDLSGNVSGVYASIAIGTAPAHGTATISGSTVTYTPAANYFGADSFTYTATGPGGISGTATVSLTVATPPAPVAQPTSTTLTSSATVVGGGSVDVDLSSLVTGVYGTIQISTPPTNGTVTLNLPTGAVPGTQTSQAVPRITATYRANAGFYGRDTFQFVAVGPGGTSAPATVTITVTGRPPTIQPKTANTGDNQGVDVDLTAGATDGPFTTAAIVSVTPSGQATAQLVESGAVGNHLYHLTVTPAAHYSGTVVVTYTVSNQFGASQPATVTVTVTARPDPTLNPDIQAISDAQAEAARDLARAQIQNFMRRAEALHHGGGSAHNVQGIQLVSLNGGRVELANNQRFPSNDPRALADRNDNGISWRGPQGDGLRFGRGLGGGGVSTLGISDDDPSQGFAGSGTGSGSGLGARGGIGQRGAGGTVGNAPALGAKADGGGNGERQVGSLVIWSGGSIGIGTRDRETGRDKITISTAGLSSGIDVKLAPNATVGIGGGYGAETNKIGGDTGHVRTQSTVVAAYGSVSPFPDTFLDVTVGYGSLDFATRRLVRENGLTALGSRSGNMWFGAAALGIDRTSKVIDWSGYGRLEWIDGTLNPYAETGADRYNLRFLSRSLVSVTSVLGGKISYTATWGGITATPRLRGEWRHEFQDGSIQALDYADVSGPAFYALNPIGWTRDQYQLGLGSRFGFGNGWAFDIEMDFSGAQNTRTGTLRASISKKL
ncbi:putative Ig domain-containing protein [Sphingomonas sp. GlSt437]|uniref:putative Ig domain-containing protein n=1 Tax=Sphingomonas sp. GlSt437 TaxID=3389970 RepID=UPI003A8387D9